MVTQKIGSSLQSIGSTVYPNGTTVKYLYGMPKPKVECFGELMKKAALKEVTRNLPKPGGVCFEEQQERLLDSAKDILVTNAKR